MEEELKNKFIIRNYTDLDDLEVMLYIIKVIQSGEISETKQGKQYSFVTIFKNGYTVCCNKRNETNTFYFYKENKNV